MSPKQNNRKIIGLDLDNVLAYTDPLIRKLISDIFAISLRQNNIIHFDYWRCGITKEQDKEIFRRFHEKECQYVKPIEEALIALHNLKHRFRIHIITGRPPETKEITLNWLRKHNVIFDELRFLKLKNKSEDEFLAFIDDHRETAYEFANNGVYSILLDYPWNQPNPVDPPNLVRAYSWQNIIEHLNNIKI